MTMKKRKGFRSIYIDKKQYKWKCGSSNVCIVDENEKSHVYDAATVKGVSADTWERGHRKRTTDGMLSTLHVKRWIISEGI